jgi:hypothetical protein
MPPKSKQIINADKETRITMLIPKVTKKALQERSVETGETMRELNLKALRDAGYPVPDELLCDRRAA